MSQRQLYDRISYGLYDAFVCMSKSDLSVVVLVNFATKSLKRSTKVLYHFRSYVATDMEIVNVVFSIPQSVCSIIRNV